MPQFGANFLIQRGRISSVAPRKRIGRRDKMGQLMPPGVPVAHIHTGCGWRRTPHTKWVAMNVWWDRSAQNKQSGGRFSLAIKIRVLTFPHEWGLIRGARSHTPALFSLSKLGRGGGAASCWQASQGFYEIFIEPCNHDIAVFLISSLIPAPNAAAHCSLSVRPAGTLFLWPLRPSVHSLLFLCQQVLSSPSGPLHIFGRHTFSFVTRGAKIRSLSSRHESDQMAAKDATAINNALWWVVNKRWAESSSVSVSVCWRGGGGGGKTLTAVYPRLLMCAWPKSHLNVFVVVKSERNLLWGWAAYWISKGKFECVRTLLKSSITKACVFFLMVTKFPQILFGSFSGEKFNIQNLRLEVDWRVPSEETLPWL